MTNEDSQKETTDDEPKIIVDSDWKEQVAREKEQAAVEKPESQREDTADAPSEAAGSAPQNAQCQICRLRSSRHRHSRVSDVVLRRHQR